MAVSPSIQNRRDSLTNHADAAGCASSRLPSPPLSPVAAPTDFWREAIYYWNYADYRWSIVEYIPGLLAVIWDEERMGPIGRLNAFPAEVAQCFVKRADALRFTALYGAELHPGRDVSRAVLSADTYNCIFSGGPAAASTGPASSALHHLRRQSHPEFVHGPRLSDPEGITQTSWLFGRFLHQVLRATKITSTTLLLALKFAHSFRQAWGTVRARATQPGAGRSLLMPVGPDGLLQETSQFRVFVMSLLLADKYTEDHSYTNKAWATLSGIPVHDINAMEREYLGFFGHALYVSEGDFRGWIETLLAICHWDIPHPQKMAQVIRTTQLRRYSVAVASPAAGPAEDEASLLSSLWNRLKFSHRS